MSLVINTIPKETDSDEKIKVIRKASIANELLAKGNAMAKVKPDRLDPDKKRTVFCFFLNEKFEQDLNEIMQRRRQEREESFEERVQREVEARLKAMSEE